MPLREIILDCETTGLSAANDRVVEIGCVETLDRLPTGRELHYYVNPEMPMPAEAFAVHGLSDDFLAAWPVFADVADELLQFVDGATLVAHNASFDCRFLRAEMERLGPDHLDAFEALEWVDTLALARKARPGQKNGLDALVKHFGIRTRREKHGALLDAQILAQVYLQLRGGSQQSLMFDVAQTAAEVVEQSIVVRRILRSRLTEAERVAHAAFIASLGQEAIWTDYLGVDDEQLAA